MDDTPSPAWWAWLGVAGTAGALAHYVLSVISRLLGWTSKRHTAIDAARNKAIKEAVVEELHRLISESIANEFSHIRQHQDAVQRGLDGKLALLEGRINTNRVEIDEQRADLESNQRELVAMQIKVSETMATKHDIEAHERRMDRRFDEIIAMFRPNGRSRMNKI